MEEYLEVTDLPNWNLKSYRTFILGILGWLGVCCNFIVSTKCACRTKNDFFIPKRILKVYLISLSFLFGTFQIPFIVWPKFGLRCVTWLKNESVSSYFGQKEYSELKVICQCWKERNKRSFASLLHSLLQRSWKSRFIATVAKKREA